jgi:alanyl-tRNA synthetase
MVGVALARALDERDLHGLFAVRGTEKFAVVLFCYLFEFEVMVVARCECYGRSAVVLDRTAFYAESGG